MRILFATFLAAAAACSGPQHTKESALVKEGSDTPPTCCCKTIPNTAEKEIVPSYQMVGRMECSSQNGECVDDVQCNGSQQPQNQRKNDGVPPPPVINSTNNDTGIP
jgi:hypothetical protein